MGLSKKHFKAVAEILLANQSHDALIEDFVQYFARENDRFMPDKFRAACHGLKWLEEAAFSEYHRNDAEGKCA